MDDALRPITKIQYMYLRKVLDIPNEEPSKEETAKSLAILNEVELMSVHPRQASIGYRWKDGFCISRSNCIFVFTNPSDMKNFAVETLRWGEEKVKPRFRREISLAETVDYAQEKNFRIIVDYQPYGERGFFFYHPQQKLWTVSVR